MRIALRIEVQYREHLPDQNGPMGSESVDDLPHRGAGICALRGSCGPATRFGEDLPCPDDGDASEVSAKPYFFLPPDIASLMLSSPPFSRPFVVHPTTTSTPSVARSTKLKPSPTDFNKPHLS